MSPHGTMAPSAAREVSTGVRHSKLLLRFPQMLFPLMRILLIAQWMHRIFCLLQHARPHPPGIIYCSSSQGFKYGGNFGRDCGTSAIVWAATALPSTASFSSPATKPFHASSVFALPVGHAELSPPTTATPASATQEDAPAAVTGKTARSGKLPVLRFTLRHSGESTLEKKVPVGSHQLLLRKRLQMTGTFIEEARAVTAARARQPPIGDNLPTRSTRRTTGLVPPEVSDGPHPNSALIAASLETPPYGASSHLRSLSRGLLQSERSQTVPREATNKGCRSKQSGLSAPDCQRATIICSDKTEGQPCQFCGDEEDDGVKPSATKLLSSVGDAKTETTVLWRTKGEEAATTLQYRHQKAVGAGVARDVSSSAILGEEGTARDDSGVERVPLEAAARQVARRLQSSDVNVAQSSAQPTQVPDAETTIYRGKKTRKQHGKGIAQYGDAQQHGKGIAQYGDAQRSTEGQTKPGGRSSDVHISDDGVGIGLRVHRRRGPGVKATEYDLWRYPILSSMWKSAHVVAMAAALIPLFVAVLQVQKRQQKREEEQREMVVEQEDAERLQESARAKKALATRIFASLYLLATSPARLVTSVATPLRGVSVRSAEARASFTSLLTPMLEALNMTLQILMTALLVLYRSTLMTVLDWHQAERQDAGSGNSGKGPAANAQSSTEQRQRSHIGNGGRLRASSLLQGGGGHAGRGAPNVPMSPPTTQPGTPGTARATTRHAPDRPVAPVVIPLLSPNSASTYAVPSTSASTNNSAGDTTQSPGPQSPASFTSKVWSWVRSPFSSSSSPSTLTVEGASSLVSFGAPTVPHATVFTPERDVFGLVLPTPLEQREATDLLHQEEEAEKKRKGEEVEREEARRHALVLLEKQKLEQEERRREEEAQKQKADTDRDKSFNVLSLRRD